MKKVIKETSNLYTNENTSGFLRAIWGQFPAPAASTGANINISNGKEKSKEITEDFINTIFEDIENAKIVIEGIGDNIGNKLVVLNKLKNKRSIVVSIKPSKNIGGLNEINDIRSIYGKRDINEYINSYDQSLIHIKDSDNYSRGIRIPTESTTILKQNIADKDKKSISTYSDVAV